MLDIFIITIFTILIGFINALKDSSALGRFKKSWWNKSSSWKMKWKMDKTVYLDKTSYSNKMPLPNDKKPWYYLGMHKPIYIERFPYSSTILVSFTDGWHLLQNIQFSLIFLGKSILLFDSLLNIVISFITMKTIFSITFELVYRKIQNRKS